MWLFGQGEENEGTWADGRPTRRGMAPEEVAAVVETKGQLPLSEYLRLRVRYFTDGAVLGTRAFVNEIFTTFRERFGGKRKDGARPLRYVDQKEGLYCLRNLQVRIIGRDGIGECGYIQAHLPDTPARYWRDKAGREVDFVIARRRDEVDAIECQWDPRAYDRAGLEVFRRYYPKGRNYLVTLSGEMPYTKTFGNLDKPLGTR